MTLGLVLAILISGFITGGLARLAIPGPDPMPVWLTLAIGLVASYRRFVQRRPIFGPGALAFPKTGLGIDQQRERLRKLGIDPDRLAPDPKQLDRLRLEAALTELHRAGLLDYDELAQKRAQLERESSSA